MEKLFVDKRNCLAIFFAVFIIDNKVESSES